MDQKDSQHSMALTVNKSTINKLIWHLSRSVLLYDLLKLFYSVNRLRTVQLKRSVCALWPRADIWPHADHCSSLRKLRAATLLLIIESACCAGAIKGHETWDSIALPAHIYEWNKGRSLCAVTAKIDAL